MFCKNCGNEIKDGSRFCPRCGGAVTGEDRTEILIGQEYPPAGGGAGGEKTELLPPQDYGPGILQGEALQWEPGSGKEKKRARPLGILLLTFIALILLAVIFILVLLSGRGKGEEASFDGRGRERQEEQQDGTEPGEAREEAQEVFTGVKKDIHIEVRQVDNTGFPEVTLYASITDDTGEPVKDLEASDFKVTEIDQRGNVTDASLGEVYQVLNQDRISVNLVLDASASMDGYNKMQQARNAANALVDQMNLRTGDQVEVISFDDYVYLEQDFSSQGEILKNAIAGIDTWGNTALYDALYAGLLQTHFQDGVKCVIGFTDGMENASSYTFDDVVTMAKNTGIPLFIIGIGEEYDAAALQNLASQCSGRYYSANVNDLESILEDIYISIYQEQQDYYVFKYTATDRENPTEFRDVVLETSEASEFNGHYQKSYVPQADINGAFSGDYMELDYILDFSHQREVTEKDLEGLSLAELRIARNEIFARHGRQFKDSMLNQWFYSRTWYLNLPAKYSPADFDALSPGPLSRLESDNAGFILEYEEMVMASRDIFPDAGNALLSDYDLALSKAVLTRALEQMNGYPSTSILEENRRLVQEALNKEEIQY